MQKATGIRRIINAFGYSWAGLRSVFGSEAAFRQEIVLCAVLVPVAFLLDVTGIERALMLASLFLILIVEILNTAIETVIERISPEIHPLSKRAKDLGSAAVLLSLMLAAVVWAAVLL